ncbi:MAG: hypothetical protein IJ043_03370 [Clostridia bacterium]|nr:hypothetical protein [Clostridia bacterium]
MKRILSILCALAMLLTMALFSIPAAAEHTTSLINLYDKDKARYGYVNADHSITGHAKHWSMEELAVANGDVIYFGPANTTQSFHLFHWNESGASTKVGLNHTQTGLEVYDTFDNGQVIYKYSVPSAGTVCVVDGSEYNDYFMVTQNQAMTVQDFHNYWDLQEGQNLYKILIDQKDAYTNANGGITASTSHSITHFIEVEEGDTITFGPANSGQGYHMTTYNSSKAVVTHKVTASGLTNQFTYPDNTVCYTYTVPAGVNYVRVINATALKENFLVQRNNPFTYAEYCEMMDIEQFEVDTESPLYDKSALFCGDSICIGTQDDGGLSGWAGRIARDYGMTYVNNGVSGASLSTARDRYWNTDGSKQQGRILWQVTKEASYYYDYIILHGGVNDAWDSYPVGSISDSFDVEDFDVNTYAGALEELFYYTIKYHETSAIGYLMNFKAPSCTSGNISDMSEYFAVGKKICEKWGIPYFDMYNNEEITKALDFTTNTNTNDYIHPTGKGYDVLYPFIAEWMETLTPYSTHQAADHEKTVVACIGDSITKGERSGDINRLSYPAQLQELLGDEYEVFNFGWGGATAQEGTGNPYKGTLQYKNSRVSDPDIVIAMFGHNDAKSANWDSSNVTAAKAKFKADLLELITEYQNMDSKPTVYIATPAWALGGGTDTVFASGMMDAIKEVASELNCTIIDINTAFNGKTELFSSNGTNVHPNAEGYAYMAQVMYKGITGKDAPTLTEKDTSVAETNEAMPLMRNFKKYPNATAYRLETVEDVEIWGNLISAGNTFAGKTVYLMNDIDFEGKKMKPLGATTGEVAGNLNPNYACSFQGTFDGQYHVFSNVYISSMYYAAALFPYTQGATIQNFGINGGRIEGFDVVGSIAGYGDGCTKMYNVWSSADVYAANNGRLYGIQGSGGLASNMRRGGNGIGNGTGVPTMTNVAYYGTISGCTYVAGLAAWGQGVLEANNCIFAGVLDSRAKPGTTSATFVRYSGVTTDKANNLFGVEGMEGRGTYDDDAHTMLTYADYSNGVAAYKFNAIDGTSWTVKYGYTVPTGTADTETLKITFGDTVTYTGSQGTILDPTVADAAEYWTDGAGIYTAEAIKQLAFTADTQLTAAEAQTGDANTDGKLDTADVILILQYLVGKEVPMNIALSDLNGDNMVTVYDAVKLLQAISQ